MTWLAWRQFRASAAAAAVALGVLGAVFALTGPGMADEFGEGLAACRADRQACMVLGQQFFRSHRGAFLVVTGLVLVLPALAGLFWGAPLVARELEAGTHSLAWNQGITRGRWLAAKLGVAGLGATIAVGIGSLAVGWWSSPLDRAAVTDFPRMEPLLFAARGIVPVGYAAFAFALGVTAGALMRRTLPAMAVTLAVFATVQVAMPVLVRPHLFEPVRETMVISDSNEAGFRVERVGPDRVRVGPGDSGAWFLSSRTVDASGQAVEAMDVSTVPAACGDAPASRRRECFLAEVARLGYRQQVAYHPAARFWPLQWAETGIYAALALGLAGVALRRIRHLA